MLLGDKAQQIQKASLIGLIRTLANQVITQASGTNSRHLKNIYSKQQSCTFFQWSLHTTETHLRV